MPLLKNRLLPFVLLAMSILSVQAADAAHAASAPECGRHDSAIRHDIATDAAFTWTSEAALPDASAPRKIALWGDSLTSARDFIDAVLNVYGLPKAAVLPSFIQAGVGVAGLSLPLRTGCATKGWRTAYAHKEKHSPGGFSKGFLSMRSETPGDTLFLDFRFPQPLTRVKRLTILYEKSAPDDSLLLGVSVDGGDESLIPLSRTAGAALDILPETPMSTIKIRLVSGQITVHGFAPHYQDTPAALVDTLSVPGGLLRSWSNAGERYFPAAPDAARDYSLILVQYGTNEGASADFDREKYAGYLHANLRRLRTFYPRSPCVLIGPPDRGVVGNVGARAAMKYAQVHHQIALAQQQVGVAYHCRFWDWQAAMGGAGAAARWAAMSPPQMQQDLTHLTAKGYAASGRLFAAAFPLDKN